MQEDSNRQFYNSYYQDEDYYDKSDYKITDGMRVNRKRILSLGCGTCEDMHYLLNDNEVWGIDGSEAAIEKALQLGVKAKVANLDNSLELPDSYFDIIVCKDLIEHLIKPDNLLKEVFRVLKDDGVLVINVPNQFYWRFRVRILFGGNLIWKTFFHDHTKDFEEWNYMHIRFFTYRGFLKLLKLCGFKVQKSYWDFGMLAHYTDPQRLTADLQKRLSHAKHKMSYGKRFIITKVLFPAYKIMNFIFPKKLRARIVSLCPGLLSASFYLRCVKK